MIWQMNLSPGTELCSPVEAVQVRRSWLPEEIHRPKQSEETREEPLAGGAGAGHGFGEQAICNFDEMRKSKAICLWIQYGCSDLKVPEKY